MFTFQELPGSLYTKTTYGRWTKVSLFSDLMHLKRNFLLMSLYIQTIELDGIEDSVFQFLKIILFHCEIGIGSTGWTYCHIAMRIWKTFVILLKAAWKTTCRITTQFDITPFRYVSNIWVWCRQHNFTETVIVGIEVNYMCFTLRDLFELLVSLNRFGFPFVYLIDCDVNETMNTHTYIKLFHVVRRLSFHFLFSITFRLGPGSGTPVSFQVDLKLILT